MIILLTGSRGFVGSHLKVRLESEGHTVLTFPRGEIQLRHYDVIINCAAELTDEDKMYASNVDLTHYLLYIAKTNGVNKFIQVGSSSEYGRTNALRTEDSVCVPSNVYDATKLAATALCQGFASYCDLDAVIARPFSLYGDGDKPRKLIPSLYRSYLDHTPFNLFSGAHDWLWVDEFVDGLILLLNAPRSVTQGQIFNFGSGVSSTNDQVVESLEAALGGKLNVVRQTGRYHAHDVDNWVADISKAKRLLGWSPKVTLANGLKEYVMREWFAADQADQGT